MRPPMVENAANCLIQHAEVERFRDQREALVHRLARDCTVTGRQQYRQLRMTLTYCARRVYSADATRHHDISQDEIDTIAVL